MAVIMFESFKSCWLSTVEQWRNNLNSLQGTNLCWQLNSSNGSVNGGIGRRGGPCMYNRCGSIYRSRLTLDSTITTTFIWGAAVKQLSDSSYPYGLVTFRGNGTTLQFTIQIDGNGRIYVRSSVGGTTLAESADGAFLLSQWQYMEVKAKIGSSESIIIKIDGVEVINASGIDLQAAGAGGLDVIDYLAAAASSLKYAYFEDLYLLDDTGTSFNDFLGDIKIDAFSPTADGYHTDYTPSVGTDHYACVNQDFGSTSDDEYIQANTVGDKDSFEITPTGDLPTILCVGVTTYTMNPDTGVAEMEPFFRIGTTDYLLTTMDCAATPITRHRWSENNPATSTAWTKSALESTEIGAHFKSAS